MPNNPENTVSHEQRHKNNRLFQQLTKLLSSDLPPLLPDGVDQYRFILDELGLHTQEVFAYRVWEMGGNLDTHLSEEERSDFETKAAAAYAALIQLAEQHSKRLAAEYSDLNQTSSETEAEPIKRQPDNALRLYGAARQLKVPYSSIRDQVETDDAMRELLSPDILALYRIKMLDGTGITDEEQEAVNNSFDILYGIVAEALSNIKES
jgi:hypothetical protein